MEGAALDKAYHAMKSADTATMSGDYIKAAGLHEEAAKFFDSAAEESPSNPATRVLVDMAEQQRRRAKYLASGKAKQDAKKVAAAVAAIVPSQSQISSQISSQLAAARAPAAQLSMPGGLPSVSSTPSSQTTAFSSVASLLPSVEDAFSDLQSKAAAAYSRAFDQALLAARGTDPSESFYLVGTQTGRPTDHDIRSIDLGARVHALEAANRAQQQAFKSGIQRLQRELALREQRLIDEHTEETDRLRAENDRLNVQITKLKSRWDDLKESAKKRSSAKT